MIHRRKSEDRSLPSSPTNPLTRPSPRLSTSHGFEYGDRNDADITRQTPRLANSPFLGSNRRGSTLLPTALRRTVLSPHHRSRRLLWATVVLASLILWISWGGHQHPVVQRAKTLVYDSRCRLLPSLPQCARDPFKGLVYKNLGGQLYYPATSAATDKVVVDSTATPSQPHPIHFLIKDAEAAWANKVARQSRTLEEAVAEYRRRYNQAPPRGFDLWFDFASRNNVQLLDEYDSIYERILPFASLPRDVLQARSEMLQHDETFWLMDHTFTLKIHDGGKTSAEGPMANSNTRARRMQDLLEGISQYLPDMNISMTGHDVPWIQVAGEAKERHKEAARKGEYIDEKYFVDFAENGRLDGWALLCPPDSPIREADYFERRLEFVLPEQRSFVKDHQKAMDVCHHPENQAIHGFTSWPGPRPGLLFPLFAFTSSSLHNDLLVPPLEQYEAPVGPDPAWKGKSINKVIFRGSTTGSDLTQPHPRKWSQRPRLCRLNAQEGFLTLPLATSDKPGAPGPTTSYTAAAYDLARHYFDFRFTGRAAQCGDEASCAAFEQEYHFAGFMASEEQNEYKYVIDVDGNGWSGRFHRLMASNTLVLKSTIFPEWFQERVQPWVHYVPVNIDYRDLWDIMAFFIGDLDGNGSHDELAEKIASAGKQWTADYWRWEDMQAYFFRLLLEYARVMNRDPNNRSNMDYEGPL